MILIFDLDLTIDNKMSNNGKEFVKSLLKKAIAYNWSVYVVTARRKNAFRNLEHLLEYGIPNDISKLLKKCNENKRIYHWVFCNDHDNHATEMVNTHLGKEPSYNFFTNMHIDQRYKRIFDVGLHKMMQISDIINFEKKNYKDVFFFDDSSYNNLAGMYWQNFINPEFAYINFYGGKDIQVFTDDTISNIKNYHLL